MPSYDYVCTSCGHEFELVQKMSDPPRKTCPKCRKKVMRKVGGGSGIIFKGSGFYATDYRSADYKSKERAEKGNVGGTPSKGPKEHASGSAGGDTSGKSGSGTKPA